MMNDTETQMIGAILERGVLLYKTKVLIPAVKKLLNQCFEIEPQLIAERSAACCNFRDLRLGITDLLTQIEEPENETNETSDKTNQQ